MGWAWCTWRPTSGSSGAALKVLAPELAADASFRERFISESVLAASLDHPNAIPVFEAGEVDGLLFIAMRYVRTTDDPKPNITGGADVLAAGSLGVAAIGQPGLRIRFDDFKVVAQ